MDRERLIERLMATFLGELSDHARSLNDVLLALEKSPDGPDRAERFKLLFRSAHSLKGAARSVGVGPVEEACHSLEDVLTAARDDAGPPAPEVFALLFEAADAIEEAGGRLRDRRDLADSPLTALLPRLRDAAAGLPVAPGSTRPAAPPAPSSPTAADAGLPSEPARTSNPPTAVEPAPPPPRSPLPDPSNLKAQTEPSAAPVMGARPADGVGLVRLPAEKLDALLSWSGELMVARRRGEADAADLEALRDRVDRWSHEWHELARPYARPSPPAALTNPTPAESAAGRLARRSAEAVRLADGRLKELAEALASLTRASAESRRSLDRAAARLDEEVRRARMLPFAEACEGLERSARDAARGAGKRVALAIEGGDVELDRSVLEWLKAPLVHLVTNAVDHGVESPEARASAGKPAAGRVTVTAALRGDQVEVVVGDDGGGLDAEALRAAARARGVDGPADPRALADLIFLPGFSTAAAVTHVSGRGVGLDVVKSRVEGLLGTIVVDTEPGRGTRFTLTVPLTLTALRALLVRAGGETYALSSAAVQRLTRVGPADLHPVGGRPTLLLGGRPVPAVPLAEALGLPAAPPAAQAAAGEPPPPKRPAVVVAAGDRLVALLVDEVVAEQEVIIKTLGPRVRRVRNLSGATILPSGRVALVLNAVSLVRDALGRGPAAGGAVEPAASAGAGTPAARRRLLVVDDSLTTRTLEQSILEAAGYEVATAVDGEDGWRALQEDGADLLVTDVDMPRMDGFALCAAVRASPRFARLPVVLFSSRGDDGDKARGNEVGADAYIVKGTFDQKELLAAVAQLL